MGRQVERDDPPSEHKVDAEIAVPRQIVSYVWAMWR
jgi:hypothetical protein